MRINVTHIQFGLTTILIGVQNKCAKGVQTHIQNHGSFAHLNHQCLCGVQGVQNTVQSGVCKTSVQTSPLKGGRVRFAHDCLLLSALTAIPTNSGYGGYRITNTRYLYALGSLLQRQGGAGAEGRRRSE
jgi:hypothetical protein